MPLLRKAEISSEQKKAFWKEVGLLNGILSIGILFLYSFDLLKDRTNAFESQLMVVGTIILLANISMGLRYLSYPSCIDEINKNGFVYTTVMGYKKNIYWKDIISFKKYEKTKTIGIFYKTRIGVVGKPINYQLGEELQEAWERWKKEQKVKR